MNQVVKHGFMHTTQYANEIAAYLFKHLQVAIYMSHTWEDLQSHDGMHFASKMNSNEVFLYEHMTIVISCNI